MCLDLGNAPRSWRLSVDGFLTSVGGRRTRTDPSVGCFSTECLRTTHALVAAHVDDFIITGAPGIIFEKLKTALRDRFRWGSWKVQSFGLGGVLGPQVSGPNNCSSPYFHVNSGINPINVDAHRDLDRPLTAGEITNIGCVCVWSNAKSDTGPQHAAALSKMQSKISQPTLRFVQKKQSKTKWNQAAGTQETTRIFDGVTATFSWLTV